MTQVISASGRASSCENPLRSVHCCSGASKSLAAISRRHKESRVLTWTHQLSGVRLGISVRQRRQTDRLTQTVKAAIFGVGAPEALLVGVVALVVFGPKGLAQAVKSLGATLRTFSPTIRELASVTNELSSTLQEQIGLDEIRNEFRNPAPTYRKQFEDEDQDEEASTSGIIEPAAEISGSQHESDEDLAAKIAESKQLAWKGEAPSDSDAAARVPLEDPQVKKFANEVSADTGKSAAELSIEELEAELKRRRDAPKS